MPAAVMRLVMTGSLGAALNPLAIAAVISKIGKPYIALVIFLFFGRPVPQLRHARRFARGRHRCRRQRHSHRRGGQPSRIRWPSSAPA